MAFKAGLLQGLQVVAAGLLLVGVLGGAALALESHGSAERRSMKVEDRSDKAAQPSGAWKNMLKFETPATYKYNLARRGRGSDADGTLTITVTKSYVSFSYELDGTKEGTLVRTKAVTPGEALMAALLASDSWNDDDIRLIWTPFMFARWADQFAQCQWRQGVVWAVRSGSTEQFTIDNVMRDKRENTIFRGRLTRSNKTVLNMDLNLNLPLPEYILWTDRTGTEYEAEIVWDEPRKM